LFLGEDFNLHFLPLDQMTKEFLFGYDDENKNGLLEDLLQCLNGQYNKMQRKVISNRF